QGATRGGPQGGRSERPHRLPRDHGWTGQDAAAGHPRRHSGAAHRCRTPEGDGRSQDRGHRSGRGESLPVRGHESAQGGVRDRAVARGADCGRAVETIDSGGRALSRASAKNHAFVTVVVDPADYAAVIAELAAHQGATTLALRRKLAAKAFARTAAYDSAIANWFAQQEGETFPERLTLAAEPVQVLRYGEKPHQQGAFYADGSRRPGIATARMVQGRELSYNNIGDTEAAYECVAEFKEPAVVVVKHANPCGVAVARDQFSAYQKADACDPVSIFGCIAAVHP